MRAQSFLNQLAQQYDPARASDLAKCTQLNGGWEAWLQVEIASLFLNNNWMQLCTREVPYPAPPLTDAQYLSYAPQTQNTGITNDSKSAARCDFLFQRKSQEQVDSTYFELKAIRPHVDLPQKDAWIRFSADVSKLMALTKANPTINGIALLATFGTFSQADKNSLSFFWSENRMSYIWDTGLQDVTRVSRLDEVSLDGQPRLFIVASSILLP